MKAARSDRIAHLLAPAMSGQVGRLAGSLPRLPALEMICSRGEFTFATPALDYYQQVCKLSGIVRGPHGDAPVAVLTRLGEVGAPDDGWWLRADPVTLVAHRNQLALAAVRPQLEAWEPQALQQQVNEHFTGAGWRLVSFGSSRWYIETGREQDLGCHPPEHALGHDISGFQPVGGDSVHWRGIVNEIQMLWHDCPVNRVREERGLVPVNSLWLWGGGRLETSQPAPWSAVWGYGALATGVALVAGAGLSRDAAQALEGGASISGPVLALARIETPDPDAALNELERDWALPLLAALDAGRLDGVMLYSGDGRCHHLDRHLRRRWWRRIHAITNVIK